MFAEGITTCAKSQGRCQLPENMTADMLPLGDGLAFKQNKGEETTSVKTPAGYCLDHGFSKPQWDPG